MSKIKGLMFVILTVFLSLNGCYKGYRGVSNSEVLKEGEGIIVIKLNNSTSPLLGDMHYIIEGYDISKAAKPRVCRLWIFAKDSQKESFQYIVPAGRYRISQVKATSSDPILNKTNASSSDITYKPRFSFYVVKGKVNFLGTWSLHRTENKELIGAMYMYSEKASNGQWYQFRQTMDFAVLDKFKAKYKKLAVQTSGVRTQTIFLRPWNRLFMSEDILKRSPQFENGYSPVKWSHDLKIAKNLLENKYDLPRLEVISQTKFIDRTRPGEIAVYDFNLNNGIKYKIGYLYKVTIVRNEKFDTVFEKFKNLYGLYNKEEGKVVWRLVNNRVVIEPFGANKTRITILSMEYIRKVSQYKPSLAGTFNPTEISGVTPVNESRPQPQAQPEESQSQPGTTQAAPAASQTPAANQGSTRDSQ